jgi:hypothetical protein
MRSVRKGQRKRNADTKFSVMRVSPHLTVRHSPDASASPGEEGTKWKEANRTK